MSDLGGLQLLPSQKRNYAIHLQGRNGLLVIALVILLVLGIAYGALSVLAGQVTDEITTTEQSIAAIYRKRNKADEEKLLNFQKQLGTTRTLLKAHTTWSASFVGIQNLIEPRMKFSTLQVDSVKRSYSFHALADSYATVAKQVAVFYGSPLVQDVKVGAISINAEGQVDVSMELTLTQHE